MRTPHPLVVIIYMLEMNKLLNEYKNIDRNIFSQKKGSRTRGHEVTLVKDKRR